MNDFELALAAAATGVEIVRAGFGAHKITEQKGRINPVTEIDRASEEAIVALLTKHRPNDGLLGEEGSARTSDGRRWIIDPLDGTVNFVHGVPQVAVSVALYDGKAPLVGVVHDVIRDEVFAAANEQGATLDGRPIRVSEVAEPHRALVATGFPYDRDKYGAVYAETVGAVLERVNGLRRTGSAALDFAWIACGRFDGYWEYSLGPWDAAAGVLIATEAGAVITDGKGRPYTVDSPHFVVANPRLQPQLQQIVQPVIPAHIGD